MRLSPTGIEFIHITVSTPTSGDLDWPAFMAFTPNNVWPAENEWVSAEWDDDDPSATTRTCRVLLSGYAATPNGKTTKPLQRGSWNVHYRLKTGTETIDEPTNERVYVP